MKNYRNIIPILVSASIFLSFTSVQGQTVMQKLKSNSETTEFAKALEQTNIDDRLNQSGPFTLFAPSNSAFTRISSVQQNNDNLLLNHIFTGLATKRSLSVMSEVTCLSGQNLKIERNGQDISINQVRIVEANIKADNGVIHIIDGVIN